MYYKKHFMVLNLDDGAGCEFETTCEKWELYRADSKHYETWIEY